MVAWSGARPVGKDRPTTQVSGLTVTEMKRNKDKHLLSLRSLFTLYGLQDHKKLEIISATLVALKEGRRDEGRKLDYRSCLDIKMTEIKSISGIP